MRRLGWGLMTALALFIAVYAIALLFVPILRQREPASVVEPSAVPL